MEEFFFTILSIWVILKLFSVFSGSSSARMYSSTTRTNYQEKSSKKTPDTENARVEVKTNSAPRIPASEGEYVEFEEIKD
ncbi:MAG: DUF4834 family protein [Bacteroidetes bacterium]|nr:DUF4834 family protein [Bacteroidota bacterium]